MLFSCRAIKQKICLRQSQRLQLSGAVCHKPAKRWLGVTGLCMVRNLQRVFATTQHMIMQGWSTDVNTGCSDIVTVHSVFSYRCFPPSGSWKRKGWWKRGSKAYASRIVLVCSFHYRDIKDASGMERHWAQLWAEDSSPVLTTQICDGEVGEIAWQTAYKWCSPSHAQGVTSIGDGMERRLIPPASRCRSGPGCAAGPVAHLACT